MEKHLLEEIDRIKEIMGVKLILEGVGGKIRDLLTGVCKETWGSGDNALRNSITESIEKQGKTAADAINILDDLASGAKTIDDFPDVNWKNVVSDMYETGSKDFRKIINDQIAAHLDEGPGVRDAIDSVEDITSKTDFDNLAKTDPIGHDEIIVELEESRKMIVDAFKEDPDLGAIVIAKSGLDDIPKKIGGEGKEAFEKAKSASAKTVKDLLFELREDIPGLTEIISLLRRWYDTFARDFGDLLTNFRKKIQELFGVVLNNDNWGTKNLEQKIKQLNDEIAEQLTRVLSKGERRKNQRLITRLTELIYAYKKEADSLPKDILDQLKAEGLISDEVYTELINDRSKFVKWWEDVNKIFDDTPPANRPPDAENIPQSSLGTASMQILKAFYEMTPVRPLVNGIIQGAKTKSVGQGLKTFFDNLGTMFVRQFMYIVWADPRLPKEVLALRNLRGTGVIPLGASLMISHTFFASIGIPFTLAILDALYQSLRDIFSDDPNKFRFSKDEDPNFSISNEILKLYRFWGGSFFGKQQVETNDKSMSEILKNFLFFWTKIDEAVKIGQDLLNQEGRFKEDTFRQEVQKAEQQVQDLKNQGEKVLNNADSTLTAASEKIKAGVDSVKTKVQPTLDSASVKVPTVWDVIEDGAKEMVDKTKEFIEELRSGSDLTLETAVALGICEKGYNRYKNSGYKWIYINKNELEITKTSVGTYFIGKNSNGEWAWAENPLPENKPYAYSGNLFSNKCN